MQAYVEATDLIMCDVIENGLASSSSFTIARRRKGQDAEAAGVAACVVEAQRRAAQNTKAKYLFYCALSPYEFNRISSSVTSKEIWDCLLVTFEGTNRVKKTDEHYFRKL